MPVLEALNPAVIAARSSFLTSLEGVPPSFAEVFRETYERRGSKGPAMGEFAIWMIPDLIPGINVSVIPEIADILFGFRLHNLLLDDIMDGTPGINRRLVTQAADYLFRRCLTALWDALPGQTNASARIHEYFNEQAVAANAEMRSCTEPHLFTPEHIADMGRKCSLSKVFAAALLIKSGHQGAPNEMMSAIEDFAVTIQAMDDIADCLEDLRDNNHTYLLSAAWFGLAKLTGKETALASLSEEETFTAIVITGALEETLTLAERHAHSSCKTANLDPLSLTGTFVSQIMTEIAAFRTEIAAVRQICDSIIGNYPNPNALQLILEHQMARDEVLALKKHIEIVGQAC